MNRIRLVAATLVVLGLVAAIGWWLVAVGGAGSSIERALGGRKPNVLLVSIDTLRADRIGSYGSDVRTPHLDRLAAEGVRFDNVATTVPFTLPAHSSMMTGTYPPFHGVRENVGYALGADPPTMAETLAAAGYDTAGFVSAFVLDSRWGIARGFDHYHDEFDLSEMESANLGSVQRPGEETIGHAIDWLDSRPAGTDAPFFAWVHLFEPHDPYEPPEPYRSEYPGRPYDGEVAYTDSLLGDLLRALRQRGLDDSTVVVVTADHGEGLGDHGETYHGYFVYDSTVRVPLLVRAPGGAAGRVVVEATSHVDLFPTVADLAGVETPGRVQGRSLRPWIEDGGEEPAPEEERAVYSESYYPLLHYGWAPLRALRNARYKYIHAPREELYDLPEDPTEQHDVADQRAATLVELADRLEQLTATIDFDGERQSATAELDDTTLRQLRALGYVAGRGGVDVDDADDEERADPKDKIEVHRSIMAAQTEIGTGALEAAETRLRGVLAADPAIIDANQMLGNVLVETGRAEEALSWFQAALARDPEHEASLFGLAGAYRDLGRREEALVGFRRLLTLDPADSKSVIAAADLLVESERPDEAMQVLREAFAADREVAPVLYNQLGELLALQGRNREAEAEFLRALEGNAELAQPRFNLAVLAEQRGDLAAARRLYSEAIEQAPLHYQAQFNLARLEGLAGNRERERALYAAAIESNADFARGYFFLAKAIMDAGGNLREAEQLAREGLSRDPDTRIEPFGWYVLADLLNRQGRSDEAREAARRGREAETPASRGS